MRFSYSYVKGEFAKGTEEWRQKIATAATAAITEAADIAKAESRADIAAAGFGKKWQNALRADVYPGRGKVSINSAAIVRHKIPYARVFEDGATITGRPLLWLPIESNLPARSGLHRWTPKKYVQSVGPLVSVNRPGSRPLLVSKKIRRDAASVKRLRAIGRNVESVPLFVGIDTVNIRKRFQIIDIVKRAAGRLAELYFKNLKG